MPKFKFLIIKTAFPSKISVTSVKSFMVKFTFPLMFLSKSAVITASSP